MATTTMSYILLISVGVTGALGEISVYKWGTSRQWPWLAGSYGMYLLCVTLFGLYFRYGRFTFGHGIIMALAVHGLSCLACDYFQFGNCLSRLEILGIACAAASLILFEVGRPPNNIERASHVPDAIISTTALPELEELPSTPKAFRPIAHSCRRFADYPGDAAGGAQCSSDIGACHARCLFGVHVYRFPIGRNPFGQRCEAFFVTACP